MNPETPVLPWHGGLWDLLSGYLKRQRIPQGLLISGHKGLGKEHLANQLAKSLLCHDRKENGLSCNACRYCRLFDAGTHPDFIRIRPDEPGKEIKIGQIRRLIEHLALTAQYDQYRVVVITPAEAMNRSAANGFLKCLEEPPAKTVIILVCESVSSLPATISSRCQKLHVPFPDPNAAVEWLAGFDQTQDSSLLLKLAQGAPLLARSYATDGALLRRAELFNGWLSIAKGQIEPTTVSEKWHKGNVAEVIFWLTSWVIDMIKYLSHAPLNQLTNSDLQLPLQESARSLKLNELFSFYDFLLLTRKRLETNLNRQLLCDEIFIRWAQMNLRH
ncbi:MAG: DNA polymerase III subunit delta' [Gammaproteobacteria bacterium]